MQISLQLLSVCSAASITQNRKLHICWRCDTGHCNWGANLRTKGQRSKVKGQGQGQWECGSIYVKPRPKTILGLCHIAE